MSQNSKVVWALEIYMLLTLLSWLNRVGDCNKEKTLSFTKFSNLNTTMMKSLYMPRNIITHTLLGVVFGQPNLIRDGVKWQVGNGLSISIWKDKWTNTTSTFCIVSPQRLLPTYGGDS